MLIHALLLAAAFAPQDSRPAFDWRANPLALLARAADTNGDGAVDGAEWSAFTASFEVENGQLDRLDLIARVFFGPLDADGDGRLTRADVGMRLLALDADSSGTIEERELAAAGAPGGAGLDVMNGLVGYGVDTNEDRTVDAAEWSAATDGGLAAPVPLSTVAAWVDRAERNSQEDRRAFGPTTLILTIAANLDVDRNGRLQPADLEALFAELDADGSGTLEAAELAAPRRQRERGRAPARSGGPQPLIPWQRSLEDALALAQATGKPILVCVNMDGEPASEQLAANRYRNPDFAALAAGFVPLLASPDRRNPRDHDDEGRRIHDRKFGRLVNAEHIDIEPELFERYFNNERVAPRHLGVTAGGEVLFDLKLLEFEQFGLIDEMLEKHGVRDVQLRDPAELGEAELLASHDAAARERLEELFFDADEPARARLAALALSDEREAQHPEILRMALRDDAAAVRRAAIEAIAAQPHATPLELYPEALRAAAGLEVGLEPLAPLANGLAAKAAAASGDDVVRPRRLARIFSALAEPLPFDALLWRAAYAALPAPTAASAPPFEQAIEAVDAARKDRPQSADLEALFARTFLRAAEDLMANGGGNPMFFLQDAQAGAQRALALEPEHGLALACLARSTYLLSEFEAAGDAALRALPRLLDQASSPLALGVIEALAQGRTRSLYEKLGSAEGWPAAWVRELLSAHELLVEHPLATEAQLQAALDAQTQLEVHALQARFLERAVERYPASSSLHNYLRWQVLRDEGARGLAAAYGRLDVPDDARATLSWYAGLAHVVAAERWMEDRRPEPALQAYHDATEDLTVSIELEPSYADSANHYTALAFAGIARIELERGQLAEASRAIRAAAEARAASFASADGLGRTPAETARALLRALEQADAPAAAELEAALTAAGAEL